MWTASVPFLVESHDRQVFRDQSLILLGYLGFGLKAAVAGDGDELETVTSWGWSRPGMVTSGER